jgi:hypothetical protein
MKPLKLNPVIASYSGEAYARIKRYLTPDVLTVIARVAQSPLERDEVPGDVLSELVEMHVLAKENGRIRLETSVFLAEDIVRIVETVRPLADELARRVLACGAAFRGASPEVVAFLGGMIGLVQGLGRTLGQEHVGVDWKNYPGKYGRSKVDFDQMCAAFDAVGPDYLNKTVLQGERYTAVFIGPGGNTFEGLLFDLNAPDLKRKFAGQLSRYLVDAYARLAGGEDAPEALRASAETANLYVQGKPRTAVITDATVQQYEGAIRALIDTAATYYADKLDVFETLLRSTTSGRQGAPPANMLLNFWRYVRKLTAQALYANGFFTDDIPERGTLTVFYENDAALLKLFLV